MERHELLDLVAYGEWATDRLTTAMRALSDADRRRRDESAFGSLLGTYTHLVAAEWVWLTRWKGTNPPAPPAWVGVAGFEEIVAHLRAVERERAAMLVRLNDADLARPVAYRTFAGAEQVTPFAALVRHVVNHGTYHRGQISMRVRQLGGQPPSTDYIVWLRLDSRAAPGAHA